MSAAGRIPIALIALSVAAPLAAQDASTPYRLDAALSRFWFEADATLGRFRGEASGADGWAIPGADTTGFRDARGAVQVHAATFRTGNGMRDGHLRDELDVAEHPGILFQLDSVSAVAAAQRAADAGLTGGGAPLVLIGRLTVRGRTTPVAMPALVSLRDDTLRVSGRLATRFTALGMEPPSRMLGLTRVKDPILLAFDAVFVVDR